RTQCRNNLRQLGLALHNYQGSYRVFPPSACVSGTLVNQPWSAQAFLLPYVEGGTIYSQIDFSRGYHDPVNKAAFPPNGVATIRVPVLLCASDPNDQARTTAAGVPEHYPLNYGLNMGAYFLFDPVRGAGGNAAFSPNLALQPSDFLDGTSNTLGLVEVKAFTPRFHDAPALPAVPPVSPGEVSSGYTGGAWSATNGHTEWVCGRAIHTGFTTTFTPNTVVPHTVGGETYDIDVSGIREGASATAPTYAIITARSYHPGLVHALLMDGSARSIGENISLEVWRNLGQRNDHQSIGEF
ncbi:MAG TPA: DUF1559 domain-containing protein, partial [Planctomycetaceae bacterium]|nr:DUF1559 domain-containing protein [Planctomycetaceae bacterium]